MNFTPRLEHAIRVAALAHRNQKRKKSGIPYIVHPFSVMTIASDVTDDEDTLIACLFHDIIEDVPHEYAEATMRQEFGDRVADIVLGVTKDDSIKDWHERSRAYLDHLQNQASDESIIVSGADKIHNLMSVLADYEVIGDEVWQKFETKNSQDQLWWYQSVLDIITSRNVDSRLSENLSGLVDQLRHIVKG